MTQSQGWTRDNFAFAIAVQKLSWVVVISVFLLAPFSPLSVAIISEATGLLWLSTVPPTSAAIAQIFGIQHLSLLSDFVFFSHQIGSFMGVWLGGLLYDQAGSYGVVWYITIALGMFASYTRPDFLVMLANQVWTCF